MIRLEPFYLMKIALNLNTYTDTYTFLLVSKRCLESLKMLHINPWYISVDNIRSFFRHFHPETVNCFYFDFFDLQIFSSVKNIRCPNFNSFVKTKKDEIRQILSKIYYIGLYIENDKYEPTCKFFMDNAKHFNSLRKVRGDLKPVVEFFKLYTSNGTELNVHFPYIIEIDSDPNLYEDAELKLITKLKKYVPQNGFTEIVFMANEHRINKKSLEVFNGINYYYTSIVKNQCNYLSDKLYVDEQGIYIDNTLDCQKYNTLITQTYCKEILVTFLNSGTLKETFEEEKQSLWEIPNCVEKISIRLNNNQETDFICLNANFQYVEIFEINNSNMVELKNCFDNLQNFVFSNCCIFRIELKNAKLLKSVAFVNCIDFELESEDSSLDELIIKNSKDIDIYVKITDIKYFGIIDSNNCAFESVSFFNKNVVINNCHNLFFYENKDYIQNKISPFEFCGIDIANFKRLESTSIHFPSTLLPKIANLDEPNDYLCLLYIS
ncbi:hypothetical protein EIN_507510 [Entamoeba invadens IP1]|uniref:Uncharacterized protein n=1 Tax=Entamoeba invadens IP1 TaxID=370355 RepID=A0A0A1UCG7_ENTIV|nr:hypothetical protein EIN_507510 [Entamoeba invadens IP1]ELP92850.1 hypothetical protein EIN_507510 [Entamoeba invadens IP1]|eukprot:XP_004259621.1 hypothetical protein EIN_507510 [Entamoeba invadens IP1]